MQINKKNLNLYLQKLKYCSEKWFNEYERTIIESLNFDEYEMWQQPLGSIFICSIYDDIEDIELLKKKEKTPPLIVEGVLESKIPSLVIVLNDKRKEDNTYYNNEQIGKKFDLIKTFNQSSNFIVISDFNSEKDNNKEDIFKRYLHKLDLYNNSNNLYLERGQYLSSEDRENLRSHIWRFFNEAVKIYFEKMAKDLDDEISTNKKGIKNGFLSIFKKTEKVEYVNVFNIYKVK